MKHCKPLFSRYQKLFLVTLFLLTSGGFPGTSCPSQAAAPALVPVAPLVWVCAGPQAGVCVIAAGIVGAGVLLYENRREKVLRYVEQASEAEEVIVEFADETDAALFASIVAMGETPPREIFRELAEGEEVEETESTPVGVCLSGTLSVQGIPFPIQAFFQNDVDFPNAPELDGLEADVKCHSFASWIETRAKTNSANLDWQRRCVRCQKLQAH